MDGFAAKQCLMHKQFGTQLLTRCRMSKMLAHVAHQILADKTGGTGPWFCPENGFSVVATPVQAAG
jgi:hypothetical protein